MVRQTWKMSRLRYGRSLTHYIRPPQQHSQNCIETSWLDLAESIFIMISKVHKVT